jgi:hypothetical protein
MNDRNDNFRPDEPEDPRLPFNSSFDYQDEPDHDTDEEELKEEDPLAELRKKFLAEEQQPEPSSKPDLLQRMTGTLASKKVPTRPRSQSIPDQGFGVLTPRPASSETTSQPRSPADPPIIPSAPNNDEIHDDFLARRLGTDPLKLRSNPLNLENQRGDPIETGRLPGDSILPSHQETESPVRDTSPWVTPPPPVRDISSRNTSLPGRRLDPLWDGADPDEESLPEVPRARSIELPPRPVEDHKMLGSGLGERQYEVNRYLSYNPKQSWWGQFRSLSGVEQGLVVALILAVLIVGALIAYLYWDSHRLAAGQVPTDSPSVLATQIPLVITAVSSGEMPIPVGMEFPGGWVFALKTSTAGSPWTPTTSEWLNGTEIRRVVGIPWNKQVEAIIQTFVPGDSINLLMNNGDKLIYKVTSVAQVDIQDSSVLYDTQPSLAVVLFGAVDTNKRWVVIAFP